MAETCFCRTGLNRLAETCHPWVSVRWLVLLQLYRPFRATTQDMCRFHTEDYINFLKGVTPQSVHEYTKNLSVFNVGDDW